MENSIEQKEWIEEFKNKLFSVDVNEVDFDTAFELKHKNLPSSIFKYRDFSEDKNGKVLSLENLDNDTIWLANPNTFNDPYDSSFSVDSNLINEHIVREDSDELFAPYKKNYSQSEQKRIKESQEPSLEMYKIQKEKKVGLESDTLSKSVSSFKKLKNKLEALILEQDNRLHKDDLRVCSFSQEKDSLLMWAHYASHHTGFCVKYDIDRVDLENELSTNLFPTIYSNDIFDTTEYIINRSPNDLFVLASVLHKSKDWEYEKEWRLVFRNRNKNLYKMPKPKAIYIGSKISDEDKFKISNIAKSKNIPVFQMILNSSKFELDCDED